MYLRVSVEVEEVEFPLARFIRRYLSGNRFPAVVHQRFMIRQFKDRFESQLSASRSCITLGVRPLGIAPQITDHGFEGSLIPRPIAIAQGAKQFRQDIG